jgi:hypothetical protein
MTIHQNDLSRTLEAEAPAAKTWSRPVITDVSVNENTENAGSPGTDSSTVASTLS